MLIKLGINTINQLDVGTQLGCIVLANSCIDGWVVNVVDLDAVSNMLLVGFEQVECVLIDVINSLELGANVDGPTQWTDTDLQFLLQLVENVKWVAALAVKLVDKNDDRRVAHAAHLHQFARLGLNTLCHVHDDNDAVHSCQCTIGVFGKVLVTRRVEDVDLVVAIVESHDRGSNRDATLLLNLHPVASGGFFDFVALDSTCHMNGSTEE